MKSCINWSVFLGLLVVHILIISSHGERNQQNLRKLLSISSSMASTSFGAGGSKMKEPKKAVDPNLRRAPTSVPNPTHN
ncbi:hypothetical protein GQ457_06G010750 [Hibiscus cannabinus]